MKKKTLLSKCVASILAVAMIIGFLPMQQVYATDDSETAYEELTFRDFGIVPGQSTADTIGTKEGLTSLDGVTISGKIKFGVGWLMLGHESVDRSDWSGIQMYLNEEGNLKIGATLFAEQKLNKVQVTSSTGSTYTTTEEGYAKIDFDDTASWCDININGTVANSELHVFLNNDSDYPRYVQMNWTTATRVLDENGNDITEIEAGATKIPANSGWVEVIYPAGTYNQFNCISRDNNDISTGTLLIKGFYADELSDSKAYVFLPSEDVISSEEAGVDFTNEYANFRFVFDYTDTGVDMGVSVNGNFIKTIQFGVSTDSVYALNECLGNCVMATGGFEYIPTYNQLSFSDWGIVNGNFVDQQMYDLVNENITSLNGVELGGQVKLTDHLAFYIGDIDDGWGGLFLQVLPDCVVIQSVVSGYETGALTVALSDIQAALNDDAFALTNNEFKLSVSFDVYGDSNLMAKIYINDTYISTLDCNNGVAAALGTKLLIYVPAGTAQIGDNSLHTLEKVEAVEATCITPGNIAYWACECGKVYADENGIEEITIEDTVIEPIAHETIHFDAITPGCHMNGQVECWYCPDCEGFWEDAECKRVTNSKSVVLPATGSDKLTHVAAKAPTCTDEGNVEYWHCPDCEGFWTNEACTQLTNSKNVIVAAAGHKSVKVDAVAATTTKTGNKAGTKCSVCKKVLTGCEVIAKIAKPAATKITKATGASKKITIKFKKVKGIKGYELQLATKKNMKKGLKKVTLKATVAKYVAKKLKAKTNYWVRIRTYKVVNGEKVYSNWTAKKKVKTK